LNDDVLESVVTNVSSNSIGKGKSMLTDKDIADISPLINQCLVKYGYETK